MTDTLILLGVLFACSAFFGAVEIANLSLGDGKVRTMVRTGLLGARLVERLKARPRRFLITMLAINTVINISAAAIATELALSIFGSNGVAIATGLVTFFILTFGEILPKTFGQANAEWVSRYASPILYALVLLLTPLTWLFEKLIDLLSFGRADASKRSAAEIAEEEIRSLFQLGVEQGAIDQTEREIAERLLRFKDLVVADAMQPLGKVIMLEGKLPIETALADAALSGYSRFPVYDGSIERILGIVHIKDIVRAYSEGKRDATLATVVRPPAIARASDTLNAAFGLMRTERVQYALVYDEQNQFVGIITLEDILEKLLGKMYDESDARKWGAAA